MLRHGHFSSRHVPKISIQIKLFYYKARYHQKDESKKRSIEPGYYVKYKHIVFDLDSVLDARELNPIRGKNHFPAPVCSCSGIRPLIQGLKAMSYTLGAVSSGESSRLADFRESAIFAYFSHCIDLSATSEYINPVLFYLDKTGAQPDETLLVTSQAESLQFARDAGVDCALTLWNICDCTTESATYRFSRPNELAVMLGKPDKQHAVDPLLSWAIELQFIAQAGQTYSKDPFDLERFDRIREISAEIMTRKSGLSMGIVKELFCNESGFQTPKLDTRAAIFEDGRILMVREGDKWSLPGGWVDVDQSVASNTVKEVREEAGLDVVPVRLIAALDGNKKQDKRYVYGICKLFVLCVSTGGQFHENSETSESGWFSLDNLPPLFTDKNTHEHIRMCFLAASDENWEVLFD